MSKEKYKVLKTNVPMWEIEGNEKLKGYAADIAELNFQLSSLEIELIEMNKNAASMDKRVSIYLSNILNIPNFEQSKYAILLLEDDKIHVYDIESLKNDEDDEDDEVIITKNDLPSEPLYAHQSNKKQISKILNYLKEYNDSVTEYNDGLQDYEDFADEQEKLWIKVKNTVKTVKYLKLYDSENDSENDVEDYDIEKHLLIVAQKAPYEWGFKYINKEDEEKFNDYIMQQLDADQIDKDEE